MLSMAGVGYQFGRAGSRDFAMSFCLVLAFSIVIVLIADLDRVYFYCDGSEEEMECKVRSD